MTEPTAEWRDELAGLPFEEAYRRLEDTVTRLEQGELPLTDSELLYRQGMELAQRCQQLLTEAEMRITQVGDGGESAMPPAAPKALGDDDDVWDLPPPLEPDDPSLFEDDDAPF